MSFINLSNEEKFALANEAALKREQEMGRRMTPAEYENFVWEFVQDLHRTRLE